MVPTFTYKEVAPPADQSPPQNGWDYARSTTAHTQPEIPYSPDSTDVAGDMGAIPKALLKLPGRVRGDHPLDSLSAIGPLAHTLVDVQTSLEPYAPFRRLAELGGYILLLGVGLTKLTLLHEAERQAGRNLFWRWALDKDGKTVSLRVGGCSEGFERLAPALEGLERTPHGRREPVARLSGSGNCRARSISHSRATNPDCLRRTLPANGVRTQCGVDRKWTQRLRRGCGAHGAETRGVERVSLTEANTSCALRSVVKHENLRPQAARWSVLVLRSSLNASTL